ncbi:CueP family metal-binding protein [Knoellia sp. CPCC 206435]|uniref:CueP family metal-binding protein n=1 Tax=Knoellia terrae TaxID=3404797 RepID=UPI003B429CA0
MRATRPLLALGLTLGLLSGCASTPSTPDPVGSPSVQGSSATSPGGAALLAKHDLSGKDAVAVIDSLDRMSVESRPATLRASVRPDGLLLSGDDATVTLPIPRERFYLSVAPYVNRTHECFHHSLTTCKGELGGKQVQVTLVEDGTGKVLADETRTMFDNGFTGFWLPRDITATLTVTSEGRTATSTVSTGADDPTCVTTMQLA